MSSQMDFNGAFDGKYEVFLSFRGKDTRRGFTDVLYEYMTSADIRVFRDDDELAIGDKIDSILDAIKSSKICIPIFSPNFAESKWCLREVTRMVELKKTIVPVFYDVSPEDVKLKEKSVYTDDFKKLQQNHGDLVEFHKWKNALKEAASIKGREIGNKSFTQFCKELINEVLSKLGPRARLEVDRFVGDTNKAEALKLLDMGSSSEEVVYLGIHGMGGIGKTTLTKLIYNEFLSSFEYCGFIPNIREFSDKNGVDGLPTYLYENLHPKSVITFNCSEQIPNLFRNKKVLLILDDVDCHEQIKKIAREPSWFGSGSRIILTSRDKKVFKDFESASKCEIQYLEMEELERGRSLELFSRCVFEKSAPPSSYQHLSERAVAYAGGLPLAITVIAKYLCNQKEVVWEDIIERLKKTPPKEVNARLMISYDSLEDEHKKIFLDIACVFNNAIYSENSKIFYMWQACGLYPHWSINVLQARSLVKVVKNTYGDGFYLQIHDQLRDLGRNIVIAKSGGDLMKQSRIWKQNEAWEVLKCKDKRKNMIEVFQLNTLDHIVVTDEEFVNFDNLRYLSLNDGWWRLIGNFSDLFPKLAWFQYTDDIRNVRNVPSNLAILDLSKSNVNENWDGWSQILMSKKLKVLDLSECWKLRKTPVFPENHLEILNLSDCEKLKYIDPSIGKLQHLIELNLSECWKVKNIPDSIGGLVKLQHLNLDFTDSLEELPESLGNLHSLRELNLFVSSLTRLPGSIIRLDKLEELDLKHCDQLQELPKLPSSLKVLHIRCDKLNNNNVPDLSNLQHLTSLGIYGARFNLLGSDFGEMQSLTSLTIEKCQSLVSLVNLDKLKQLRMLRLSECPSLVRIPGVGKLRSLTKLTVQECDSLEFIDDITGLEELGEVTLSHCKKLTKVPGLVNLKSLRSLAVEGCKSREILQVASQLEKLHGVVVKGSKLENLPGDEVEANNCDDDDMQLIHNNLGVDLATHQSELEDSPGRNRKMNRLDSPEQGTRNLRLFGVDINVEDALQLEELHGVEVYKDFSIEDLTTRKSENLPRDEVEANNCDDDDMQIHNNIGVDLATHQSDLEDLPCLNRKRNWLDSPEQGTRNLRLFGVDIRVEVASQPEELHGVEVYRDFSIEDLTTRELENLPGGNVEANNDDMQRQNLGGGLPTDQSENLPGDDVEADNCEDNDMQSTSESENLSGDDEVEANNCDGNDMRSIGCGQAGIALLCSVFILFRKCC